MGSPRIYPPAVGGRVVKSLEQRVADLEAFVASLTGVGYICKNCGMKRPNDWFIYEIEKDGDWFTPCCASCAREHKSRGPYKQSNIPTTQP